jgi:hypothetical protein
VQSLYKDAKPHYQEHIENLKFAPNFIVDIIAAMMRQTLKLFTALMKSLTDKGTQAALLNMQKSIDYCIEENRVLREQLEYVINQFMEHYHHERPHLGLGGKIIAPLPQDEDGEVVEFQRLCGLLKSYRRIKKAA